MQQKTYDSLVFGAPGGLLDSAGPQNESPTTTTTTHESAESILAHELNKLSFKERETIHEEIHGIGVGCIDDETPERLTESLQDLQTKLDALCSTTVGRASAFCRGQEIEGSYLNSTEFRSMFLRCEIFDSGKAAARLCHYAQMMEDLYGDIGLKRMIELSDIPAEEIEIMKWGRLQNLPARDRAGRMVHIGFHSEKWDRVPTKTKLRIIHYYLMSLVVGNVDSQLRGIVILFWMHNYQMNMDAMSSNAKIDSVLSYAIPVRFGAAHYLFPSDSRRKGSFAIAKVISKLLRSIRPHIRIHWGSPIECFYTLESFGIPSRHIPLDLGTGQVNVAYNLQWLQSHATNEQTPAPVEQQKLIEVPNDFDILLGRGKTVMNHPGNVMFRRFVDLKIDLYASIHSKRDSVQWTRDVVSIFRNQYGTRFLKEERRIIKSHGNKRNKYLTAWTEVSNEIARNKVRVAFRDAIRNKFARSAEKQTAPQTQLADNPNKIENPGQQIVDSSTSSFLERNRSNECCSSDECNSDA